MDDVPILHVWGQHSQHMPLLVVGNRAGLLALRAALDAAIEAPLDSDGQAVAKGPEPGPTTSDGEHYEVVVWRDETPWQGERWQGRSFPYTGTDYLDCSVPDLPAYPTKDAPLAPPSPAA